MPGKPQPDGLAMLKYVHQKFPAVKIVVLTKIATPTLIAPIMQTGALAVVEKSAAIKEIANAIVRASQGHTYLTPSLQHEFAVLGTVVHSGETKPVKLSPREIDVVRFFAIGYSNNQIAETLGVSAKTTSRQKKDAMRKLSARNDAELYAHAKEMGLI
jgi:two-component system capsular synthesis response regulator RcsB